MSIVNQYTGATVERLGGTYLDSRAIVNIKEGYVLGASRHSVNLNGYKVEDMSNSGVFSERVSLSLSSPLTDLNSRAFPYSMKRSSHEYHFEQFDNTDTLNQHWSINTNDYGVTYDITGWGLRNRLHITFTEDSDLHMSYTNNQDIPDVRVRTRFRSTVAGVTAFVDFRLEDGDNFYRAIYSTNSIAIKRFATIGNTVLATKATGVSILADSDYDLSLEVKDSKIYTAISKDLVSFTGGASLNIGNDSNNGVYHESGAVRIGSHGSGDKAIWSNTEVLGVGEQLTSESTARIALGAGDIFNTEISNRLDDVSLFSASAGSSWTLGTSNDVYLMNNGGGTTVYHQYAASGITLKDFVFEVSVSGSSGDKPGIMLKSLDTTSKYVGWHQIDKGVLTGNYTTRMSSNGASVTDNIANYIGLDGGKDYRLKMIKEGYRLNWYVNDLLAMSTTGSSLMSQFEFSEVALTARADVATGTTTRFFNPKISSLDTLVDDVQIETNTTASSILNRAVPSGFASIWSGDKASIFEIGSSRGSAAIDNYIVDSSQDTSNNRGSDYQEVYGKGTVVGLIENIDTRVSNQVDKSRIKQIIDNDMSSANQAQRLYRGDLNTVEESSDIQSISILGRPTLEKYDLVDYIDSGLGVSSRRMVASTSRVFSSADGGYINNLQLIGISNGRSVR